MVSISINTRKIGTLAFVTLLILSSMAVGVLSYDTTESEVIGVVVKDIGEGDDGHGRYD